MGMGMGMGGNMGNGMKYAMGQSMRWARGWVVHMLPLHDLSEILADTSGHSMERA